MKLRSSLAILPLITFLAVTSPGFAQDAKGFSGAGFSASPRRVPDSALGMKASFAPVVKAVAPAVVNVYAKGVVRQNVDPFWQMFSGMAPQNQVQQSLGSGVIVRGNGVIVTNNHVIDGLNSVVVVLNDRREYPAKVLLADPRTDLAVLQIDTKGQVLPTLSMDDGQDLQVGDLVLAIGDPFGVGQTVTNGIVSALDRTDVGHGDGSYIQTDAAINPGNSGGALVDMDGHLIGINSMIVSQSGGSSGVGFAIPAALVRHVVDSALSGAPGSVAHLAHPWLGAKADTVTSDIARSLGMDRPQGVLVSDVYKGGPADQAGLKTGDVILKLDNQEIDDSASLRYRINLMQLNQNIDVQALRNGKPLDLHIKAAAPSNSPPRDERVLAGQNPFGGAHVVNLSPAVADEIGVDPFDAPSGVMIFSIDPGQSYAAVAGLAPGDIIRNVNGKTITTTADIDAIVKAGARRWAITIVRGGQVIQAQFS